MQNIKKIALDVLSSKKFSRLGLEYLEFVILEFLNKDESNTIKKMVLEEDYGCFKKNKHYKKFLKNLKEFLHNTYGVYQVKDVSKKDEIFKIMRKTKDKSRLLELHKEMLHCHSSSRERKDFYDKVYEEMFKYNKKPMVILDLGCGLNVFSLPFMKIKNFKYIGIEPVKEDVKLINAYIKNFGKLYGFSGVGVYGNFFDKECLGKINKIKCDFCFLLKMTDVLDYGRNDHKRTEEFLKNINSKCIVVSFPTRTVSNKKMNKPRRKWFELMSSRLGFSVNNIELENEIFYFLRH